MAIKWDDNQKVTQAMQKIYNSSFFNQKHIMEWEDKYDVVCKMFFQKNYELKKRYSNARPGQKGLRARRMCRTKSKQRVTSSKISLTDSATPQGWIKSRLIRWL